MMYRVAFEFRLTRVTPWTQDGTDFYSHVEDVRAKVATSEFVADVLVVTDRADSALTFDFLVDASHPGAASAEAVRVIRDAIENCSARHAGMSSEGTTLAVAGARPGLETPVWHRRRLLVDRAA